MVRFMGGRLTLYKTSCNLSPTDPVVGPGTMKALDADIFTFDSGTRPAPRPPVAPATGKMQGKFFYRGGGTAIPGINMGLSVSMFSIWLRSGDGEFRGYTAASNLGLPGIAILETPLVNFVVEDPSKFSSLHGSVVDVTINSSIFIKSGGIAGIQMVVRRNNGPSNSLSFSASDVKGMSASGGDIQFTSELMVLAGADSDPNHVRFFPF